MQQKMHVKFEEALMKHDHHLARVAMANRCVAVCCSVLQCCAVLLCGAVWCSLLQCVAVCCCSMLHCVLN